jgi:hypothetical protein
MAIIRHGRRTTNAEWWKRTMAMASTQLLSTDTTGFFFVFMDEKTHNTFSPNSSARENDKRKDKHGFSVG